MKQYYVYIMTNQRNGTLYIGLTNDLHRRVLEHKQGIVKGFTKKYGLNMLVYYKEFYDHNEAFITERRMKNWKRIYKLNVIEEMNPEWKDLGEDWYE